MLRSRTRTKTPIVRRPFIKRPCRFCIERVIAIDYKDLERLSRCVTDRGKIIPSRLTGACAKHQRMVTRAVKRARFMALLPYATV